MAQKFYNVAKAAELLGISPSEVNEMREGQQLHGYRDGADWKFKAEEVDAIIAAIAARGDDSADDEADVLVTEQELGLSDPGASGTVIGPPPVNLDEEPLEPKDALDSAVNGFEELEFSFDDSQLDLSSGGSSGSGKISPPGSGIDLSPEALDDDDLVLGGSGGGSDLTLGGDSGISLIDPTDSGLSLEEPLDLAGSGSDSISLDDDGGDSLVLSDDSMLSLDKVSDGGSSKDAAGESDFTLTPMDEVLDDDSSQSDSQVIDLDIDEQGELETMPAMVDEAGPAVDLGDVSQVSMEDMGQEMPLGGQADAGFGAAVAHDVAMPQSQTSGTAVMSEVPYSGLNIISLVFCTILLSLVGMMMYDVMQNMWSWNGVHSFNSPLLSWLSSMLG